MIGDNIWEDRGSYYVSLAPQGTEIWEKQRLKRVTGARVHASTGKSRFSTKRELAEEILGRRKIEQNDFMKHGVLTEPEARRWYERKYKKKVTQLGLAVPKWDLRLGASVDGDLEDGMIEIKCPMKMYECAKTDNIFPSHYDQMQLCMVVLDKEWCDYVVYCKPERKVFVKRVEFNRDYWINSLYPQVKKFLEEYIDSDISIQRIDPPNSLRSSDSFYSLNYEESTSEWSSDEVEFEKESKFIDEEEEYLRSHSL
jgi:putative phage-type endonuclease